MGNAHPETAADLGYVHPDGAIRCPRAFHSVKPGESDLVQFRVRAALRPAQVTGVPVEVIKQAFLDALRTAGFQPVDVDAGFLPPEHNCDELIQAAQTEGT